MGVSATGKTKFTNSNVAKLLVTFLIVLGGVFYFYGPLMVPALKNGAIDTCNELEGGNFRSYRLEWVSWTLDRQVLPHWECTSISTEGKNRKPVDLGWYAGFAG